MDKRRAPHCKHIFFNLNQFQLVDRQNLLQDKYKCGDDLNKIPYRLCVLNIEVIQTSP